MLLLLDQCVSEFDSFGNKAWKNSNRDIENKQGDSAARIAPEIK